jgi:hypothetical protein
MEMSSIGPHLGWSLKEGGKKIINVVSNAISHGKHFVTS